MSINCVLAFVVHSRFFNLKNPSLNNLLTTSGIHVSLEMLYRSTLPPAIIKQCLVNFLFYDNFLSENTFYATVNTHSIIWTYIFLNIKELPIDLKLGLKAFLVLYFAVSLSCLLICTSRFKKVSFLNYFFNGVCTLPEYCKDHVGLGWDKGNG